jgi:hypothetical protein
VSLSIKFQVNGRAAESKIGVKGLPAIDRLEVFPVTPIHTTWSSALWCFR